MGKKFIPVFLGIFLISIFINGTVRGAAMDSGLSTQQKAIIPIAAYTANGDTEKLKIALEEGLAAGLSINEIKEVLIQLYAYAGFPRSLTAIATFMQVLENRKAKGINDKVGAEPKILPQDANRLEIGTRIQTELVGKPVAGPLFEFAPAMDKFLKEHLFCDIFYRNILSTQDREIATISALAALPAPSQLASHLQICLNVGLTDPQLKEVAAIMESKVSVKNGQLMLNTLKSLSQK